MSHFVTLMGVEDVSEIDYRMERFCECTEDPDYLDFEDHTEECRTEYENGTVQLVRMPNGKIYKEHEYEFSRKFLVRDGLVYQKDFGPLHHEKRSKRAKKIKALPPIPWKKYYPEFKDYAEQEESYAYSESRDQYGYYYNPDAQWDWFVIGGRWPYQLLVSENDEDAIVGDRDSGDGCPAPKGYKWVAGAKKGAVAWDLMKQIAVANAHARYALYKGWLDAGEVPKGAGLVAITDEGLASWGEIALYKDETLEDYLHRNHLDENDRVLPNCYSFVNDSDEWVSQGDMGWFGISSNNKEDRTWNEMVAEFIDSIPDEDYIVSIDCHI